MSLLTLYSYFRLVALKHHILIQKLILKAQNCRGFNKKDNNWTDCIKYSLTIISSMVIFVGFLSYLFAESRKLVQWAKTPCLFFTVCQVHTFANKPIFYSSRSLYTKFVKWNTFGFA